MLIHNREQCIIDKQCINEQSSISAVGKLAMLDATLVRFVRQLCLLLAITFVLIESSFAVVQDNVRFHRYSLQQGLSQQAVFAMLQDRKGFMWFATQEGLNRFDGYQFKTFYHESDNVNSISHDAVYHLLENINGSIWIATEAGLDLYDPNKQSFVHYTSENSGLNSNRINVLFKDTEGVLWVGTDGGGLSRFDNKHKKFHTYRKESKNANGLTSDIIRSIHQDQSGQVWIGTDSGVNRYLPETDSFIDFKNNPNAPSSIIQDSIRSIHSDRKNRLWFGSYQNGLIRLSMSDDWQDQDSASFEQVLNSKEKSDSLCDNRVRDIFEDNSGTIWIATDNGLCRWSEASANFKRFNHDETDPYSISDNRTLSIYQDRGGVLWLGTFGGLNKWVASGFQLHQRDSNQSQSLSSNIITSFAPAADGNMWVGTYDGLNLLNAIDGEFKQIKVDSKSETSLSDNRIMSLFSANDGTLWIGTRGNGVDRYNPETNTFFNYRNSEADKDSLSGNGITSILQDREGNIWVGAYNKGVNLLDQTTNKFTHFRHDPNDSNSLSSDRVVTLFESTDGLIWIGTEGGGLNSLDEENGKITRYKNQANEGISLSNNVAWSIYESSNGDLWIATWGGGLNRWTQEDRAAGIVRFRHYGKKNGLVSNIIYDVVEDEQEYLWLSTNLGLERFDPRTNQIKHFDVSHGLQDNEFNHNASGIANDGRIYFGGSKGFNTFYSENIGVNQHQPQVELTSVKVLTDKAGSERDMSNQNRFEFDYQDYVVAFDFVGLDFVAPEKNRYRYRLEGFNYGWIDMGTSRTTTFTNLPAGSYVFRVQAANSDGVWSERGLSKQILVKPAPWRTWWAHSIYTILVGSLLIAYLRSHARKLKEKADYSKHLEQQVKQRTSELTLANQSLIKAKSDAESGNRAKGTFLSIISHELRTPMTTIIGFAESLLDEKVSSNEQGRRVSKIVRSAKHLLGIMNNVLDVSKIEAEQMLVEKIVISPARILTEVSELMRQQAKQKELDFLVDFEFPFPDMIESDPTRLKQILINLCSNAIKFSHAGQVSIIVRSNKDNRLYFSIVDTGIGIAEDKIQNIFEPFAQADSSTTRKYGGTGLGLSISKRLAVSLGGEMVLESKLGEGSRFTFSVDMGNTDRANWLKTPLQIERSVSVDDYDKLNVPMLAGNILLAEDWVDNQDLIKMIIDRTGASVSVVENGAAAVEKALSQSFDLILMDIQMPELDGIEATSIIRGAGFSKPIVALTADVSESDIRRYLSSGFDDYLSKPINLKRFYSALCKYLPQQSEKSNVQTEDGAETEGNVETENNKARVMGQEKLVNAFVSRLPLIIKDINQAINDQLWSEALIHLHNLKGLGGSFGYPEVSQLARKLYELVKNKDFRQIEKYRVEMDAVVQGISLNRLNLEKEYLQEQGQKKKGESIQ
jgi:signal transduction histidine kinase/ligand-binding sensor domain-containing protein/CheY-like chemotaxis protein/HPt (histidine-containing phosphotransfer) domain-containing protein